MLTQVVIPLHPCRVAIPLGWSLSEAARRDQAPGARRSGDGGRDPLRRCPDGQPRLGSLDQLSALQ